MSEATAMGAIVDYVARRETPVRVLADEAMAQMAPRLRGKVVELGGFADGRREFATGASEYVVTNIVGDAVRLDACNMDLPSESVDGFICESMLEHVEHPERVVAEVFRVLRPGGRFLVLTPWMYPFHSAPGDFCRYSEPALRGLLHEFDILDLQPLGNFWTAVATFMQLKVSPWRRMSKGQRLARIVAGGPLLACGLAFYGVGRVSRERDDFSTAYCVLAEKRTGG